MPDQQPFTPQYESPDERSTVGLARASMGLGIGGAIAGIFGIGALLGVAAAALGIIALILIRKNPRRYGGKGLAITGVVTRLSAVAIAFAMLLALIIPPLRYSRELSNRSTCVDNLRAITHAMNLYASANADVFPVLPSSTNTGYTMTSPGTPGTDPELTINSMFAAPPASGPVLAGPWTMVIRSQVSPNQFICKSDPFAAASSAARPSIPRFPVTFQTDPANTTAAPEAISYSFAYPWTGTPATVGKWWTALSDASLPIMSDIAPANGERLNGVTINAQGGGNGAAASPSGISRTWNSPNHMGDGINTAYSDAHVEWSGKPTIGQNDDNIWGVGTGSIAVPPAGSVLPIGGSTAPFDTVMVPTRTASGALR